MKNGFAVVLIGALLGTAFPAEARDDRQRYSVRDALERADIQDKLNHVKLYFGDAPYPAVAEKYGEFQSNKKTNAFNKTDKEACQWAFLSAVIALQERAVAEGGNAVINVTSNYKNQPYSSQTDFECGAGKFVAGATLKGQVVKLK